VHEPSWGRRISWKRRDRGDAFLVPLAPRRWPRSLASSRAEVVPSRVECPRAIPFVWVIGRDGKLAYTEARAMFPEDVDGLARFLRDRTRRPRGA